jgi:hypothetical protein
MVAIDEDEENDENAVGKDNDASDEKLDVSSNSDTSMVNTGKHDLITSVARPAEENKGVDTNAEHRAIALKTGKLERLQSRGASSDSEAELAEEIPTGFLSPPKHPKKAMSCFGFG